MEGRFLFLGTGASMGTPVIACKCRVCQSVHPHNKRLRPSGLLKLEGKQILFDVGPDFREQALRFGIDALEGVILTHSHYDHIAGLDDLRVFYFYKKQTLPCLLSRSTYDEIKMRTPYLLENSGGGMWGAPRFNFHILDQKQDDHFFCNFRWRIVSYIQKGMEVTGYRIGNFAYVMDLKDYPPAVLESLRGVEVLVLSGLRDTPSPAHLTLDEALAFSRKVAAKETWFSHISHELDHDETNRRLPQGVQLAYDGLEVSFVC